MRVLFFYISTAVFMVGILLLLSSINTYVDTLAVFFMVSGAASAAFVSCVVEPPKYREEEEHPMIPETESEAFA